MVYFPDDSTSTRYLTSRPARRRSGVIRTLHCRCPQCSERIKLPVALAGYKTRCPGCRRTVSVPIPPSLRRSHSEREQVQARTPTAATPHEALKAVGSSMAAPLGPAPAPEDEIKNRRRWPRYDLRDARARVASLPEGPGFVMNLDEFGGGGLRLCSRRGLMGVMERRVLWDFINEGQVVPLMLDIPAFDEKLVLQGEVVRTEDSRRGRVFGIRYHRMPLTTRDRLATLALNPVLRCLPRNRGDLSL